MPNESKTKYKKMCSVAINFFHIFAVAPALAYVFYENYNGRALTKNAAIVGLVVVVLILLYHGYLAVTKMMAGTITLMGSTVSKSASADVTPNSFAQGSQTSGVPSVGISDTTSGLTAAETNGSSY